MAVIEIVCKSCASIRVYRHGKAASSVTDVGSAIIVFKCTIITTPMRLALQKRAAILN